MLGVIRGIVSLYFILILFLNESLFVIGYFRNWFYFVFVFKGYNDEIRVNDKVFKKRLWLDDGEDYLSIFNSEMVFDNI